MTVQILNDIKGYKKLSVMKKVRFIVLLENYLKSIDDLDNRNMDVISVKAQKHNCFMLTMSEDNIEFMYMLNPQQIT